MNKYLLFLSKTFLLSLFYTFYQNSDVILLLIVFYKYSRSFDSRPLQWPYRDYSLPYSNRTLSGRSLSTTVHELTSVTVHRSWSTVHLSAFMRSAFTFRCFFKSLLNNFYSKIFTKYYFFLKFSFKLNIRDMTVRALTSLRWNAIHLIH